MKRKNLIYTMLANIIMLTFTLMFTITGSLAWFVGQNHAKADKSCIQITPKIAMSENTLFCFIGKDSGDRCVYFATDKTQTFIHETVSETPKSEQVPVANISTVFPLIDRIIT